MARELSPLSLVSLPRLSAQERRSCGDAAGGGGGREAAAKGAFHGDRRGRRAQAALSQTPCRRSFRCRCRWPIPAKADAGRQRGRGAA